MPLRQLDGKTALVTGASSGLGRHFAGVLAREGASVVLASRNGDSLLQACGEIQAAGGTAEVLVLDVTDVASVERTLAGAEPFDIVVNNAGISGEGSAMDIRPDVWQQVIATNLTGVFNVAQATARGMKDAGRPGSIINLASILGLRVAGHLAAYAASKAAVIQMTKALALEWARHDIRVNALCPGYFETPLNAAFFADDAGQALLKRVPQRRLGRLSELDGPLLLLASDAGSFMTGCELVVDGGHLVSSL